MAKKKEPSLEDAVINFKDVMLRSNLSDYSYVNKTLLSKNAKDVSILVNVEQTLWNALMEDEEFKSKCTELNVSDPEESKLLPLFNYAEEIDNGKWVEIPAEDFYKGTMLKITVNGFKYDLDINKTVLPLKLKKAEFNNISYQLFTNPELVLALKKKFEPVVDGTEFSILRMYRVI